MYICARKWGEILQGLLCAYYSSIRQSNRLALVSIHSVGKITVLQGIPRRQIDFHTARAALFQMGAHAGWLWCACAEIRHLSSAVDSLADTSNPLVQQARTAAVSPYRGC
jgi:hypothetical protein